MTKYVKNYSTLFIILLFISILYFLLRLPNLTLQPIFADEAIYIRWAQVMKAEPTLRFLPLSDGKTPLFMWTMIPLFKIFDDPLFAGRMLSVFAGFTTLLGAFFLGWKCFNKKTGLWSAFLIAVTPFMVFFDRMALVDSMLAAFSIWSVIVALLLVEYKRVDLAMVLGYLFGGALLTKTPGFFNILSLPATLLLFNWRSKKRQLNFVKLFGLWIIALAITFAIYSILRLGPGFSMLNLRNQDYVFSPLEILAHPLNPFIPHLFDVIDWFLKLLTPPVLAIVILGIIVAVKKKNKYALVILLWSLIPLLVQMAFLKTFTARYILSSIPLLLVLAGWGVDVLFEKFKIGMVFTILIVILLFTFPLLFNYYLLTNPFNAPLPENERRGYFEDWTAGYGLKDIAVFLIEESQRGIVVVGTEGSFGTLPDGLQIYLDKHSHQAPKDNQVIVIGGKGEITPNLREAAIDHPTYFVANKSRFSGDEGLEIIKEYPKAKGADGNYDAIVLFRVLPDIRGDY